MKTTPIYGISYIEGSDLVSNAAAGFKKAAETTEAALKLVDQRSTIQGVKPVIAGTLATLATMRGATGQTGYVTSDGNNNGPYCWNGSAWVKYAQNTQIDSLRSQIAAITQGYEAGTITGRTNADAVLTIPWKHHTTAPKSVTVTVLRRSDQSDISVYKVDALLWSVTASYAWVRFRNQLTDSWATNFGPVSVTWAAYW